MTPRYSKRLAIIGAGSSGLVTLKHSLDSLPDWEINCFEKSDSVRGAWGNPYEGFISTSSKYATQFTCFRKYDTSLTATDPRDYNAYYCENEFGDYLDEFARFFKLNDQ